MAGRPKKYATPPEHIGFQVDEAVATAFRAASKARGYATYVEFFEAIVHAVERGELDGRGIQEVLPLTG